MTANGYIPASAQRWTRAATKVGGEDVARSLSDHVEGVIDGSIRTLPMPWTSLARITKALLPGSITILCGDPGSTKSLMTVELFWNLHKAGERVALFMLEGDKKFHASRLLAQLSGESNITNTDWVRANPARAREIHHRHSDQLRDFGHRMWASPNDSVSQDSLLKWIDENSAAGCKLLGIDPVTAASPDREPWLADQRFVTQAKKRLDAHGSTMWCVTHPRKGVKGMGGWDDLAGGAAWARFTDTVLWLERPPEAETVMVATQFGRQAVDINRRVRACKARNGIGCGMRVGMWFDSNTLKLEERGVIVGKEPV